LNTHTQLICTQLIYLLVIILVCKRPQQTMMFSKLRTACCYKFISSYNRVKITKFIKDLPQLLTEVYCRIFTDTVQVFFE